MFQGMLRKRGRPPEPPLQIGGYDEPSYEESNQIPAHQLRDAPRQLPLPPVREFGQSEVVQQEQPGLNNAMVESNSSQQGQHDVDMLNSYDRRLSNNPRENQTLLSRRMIKLTVMWPQLTRSLRLPLQVLWWVMWSQLLIHNRHRSGEITSQCIVSEMLV